LCREGIVRSLVKMRSKGGILMYNENNRHCRECICSNCELRGSDKCDEGPNLCDKCKNEDHTIRCFYFEDED
jgi:hypothetical protein